MNPGRAIQILLIALLWVVIVVGMLLISIASALIGLALPVWWIVIPIGLGGMLTALLTSTETFSKLNHKLSEKLGELSDSEMQEVLEAMDEVKENLGLSIELPVSGEKRKHKHKRDDIDRVVRNLSDTELVQLKEQLRGGHIDEERLIAWLEEQRGLTE